MNNGAVAGLCWGCFFFVYQIKTKPLAKRKPVQSQAKRGQVDLVIENQLQPYDIVPLIPILEGAGGVVTGRDGGTAQDGGFVVAAGNRELHARALELLNSD